MKHCGNCGQALEDYVKFCGGCGAVQEETSAEKKPEKRKKGKIIVAVFVIVVLIATGVVIFGFFRKNVNDSNETESIKEQAGIMAQDAEEQEIEIIYKYTEYRYEDLQLGIGGIASCEFDESGYIQKEIYRDLEGNLEKTYVYTWEDNKTIVNCFCYDSNGYPVSKGIETYDEERNQLTGKHWDANGLITSEIYYDENGNVLSWTGYEEGKKSRSHEYNVDENTTTDIIYAAGEETWRDEVVYDEEGKMVIVYNGGEKTAQYEYAYDEAGNMTDKYIYYYEDGELVYESRTEYIYNTEGKVTEEKRSYGDFLESYTQYTYDTAGNEVLRETFSMIGSGRYDVSFREEYSYDTAGNLTKYEYTYYDENGNIESGRKKTYDTAGNMLSRTDYGEDGKETYKAKWKYQAFEIEKRSDGFIQQEKTI